MARERYECVVLVRRRHRDLPLLYAVVLFHNGASGAFGRKEAGLRAIVPHVRCGRRFKARSSSEPRLVVLAVLLQSLRVIRDGSVRTFKRSIRSGGTRAASTAFQMYGAAAPDMRSRPRANCPLRIRCSNSTPAIVIAACPKFFNPSIGRGVRLFLVQKLTVSGPSRGAGLRARYPAIPLSMGLSVAGFACRQQRGCVPLAGVGARF
jgi:hypothetical protein